MPKIMIIKYQQFAKTIILFPSLSIYFFPHFCTFFPGTRRNQDLGMGKNGVGPPLYYYSYTQVDKNAL